MDLPKFVSMLYRRALFFATAASLGDPFEGSYPVANRTLRPQWYGEWAAEIDRQSRSEKLRRLHSTLISCWHMNTVESAAMWQLYARQGYGIAIRSTYDRLKTAIQCEQPFYIGVVRYLRYDSDPMPEGNLLDPFVHKRASFAHEQELRVVTERYIKPGTTQSWDLSVGPPPYFGEYIAADLDVLIEAVYLAPSTPSWQAEVAYAIADKFNLGPPIRASDLDQAPHY